MQPGFFPLPPANFDLAVFSLIIAASIEKYYPGPLEVLADVF